jgi:hypothetical protein
VDLHNFAHQFAQAHVTTNPAAMKGHGQPSKFGPLCTLALAKLELGPAFFPVASLELETATGLQPAAHENQRQAWNPRPSWGQLQVTCQHETCQQLQVWNHQQARSQLQAWNQRQSWDQLQATGQQSPDKPSCTRGCMPHSRQAAFGTFMWSWVHTTQQKSCIHHLRERHGWNNMHSCSRGLGLHRCTWLHATPENSCIQPLNE